MSIVGSDVQATSFTAPAILASAFPLHLQLQLLYAVSDTLAMASGTHRTPDNQQNIGSKLLKLIFCCNCFRASSSIELDPLPVKPQPQDAPAGGESAVYGYGSFTL